MSITIFVVIVCDLSNHKCVETGFVIQLIKSHPKVDGSKGFKSDLCLSS